MKNTAKAAPKPGSAAPLYVFRPVENAAEIIAWAKSQGFEKTLPADDLHVTICYSKEPVHPEKADADLKPVSAMIGKRQVKKMGDAVCLTVPSTALQMGHKRYMKAGASFDYDKYQPHITITYDAGNLDLSEVNPFSGPIYFGSEQHREIDPDAKEKAVARMADEA